MVMNKKYKYIYDIKSGHFIKKLNEDDSNVTTDTTADSQEQSSSSSTELNTSNSDTSTNSTVKSVESDETIQKINADMQANELKFLQDLQTQLKLLDAAKVTASKKEVTGGYDPVATDANVLNIMKKMNDMKKQHALDIANFEELKITLLTALSKANESYYTVPDKYKWLNESNIHTAKIYMKGLIGPENNILRGMADFKRAFKDTNLLYGKDREGYFVIAVDKDDFDSMYDTLEEVGYLRDDIIDTVMPQLFDRHDMIQ